MNKKERTCITAGWLGIVGLITALFPLGYAVQAVLEEGMRIIPLIVFWIAVLVAVIVILLHFIICLIYSLVRQLVHKGP